MGYSPIQQYQIVKTLDTGEKPDLGGLIMPYDLELYWVRLVIYVHNTAGLGGSEQLRLGLYSRPDLTGLVVNSDWASVGTWSTEVGTANGNYQTGFMRFDFSRQHLDSDSEYFLAIETSNYTRNGDTFYLGVICDWPAAVNDPSELAGYYAAAAHFFGYTDRTKPT